MNETCMNCPVALLCVTGLAEYDTPLPYPDFREERTAQKRKVAYEHKLIRIRLCKNC